MQNESLINSTNKKLKTIFYIWFFGLLVLFFFCFTMEYSIPKLNEALGINLQQVLILCMLGGIPGILVWSRNKLKTLAEIADISERLKLYCKYIYIRQSVFFALAFFTLFIMAFTIMSGAFLLFWVVICLCMFIAPTKGRIVTEACLTEPELKQDPEQELEQEPESEQEQVQDKDPKSES